MPKTLTEVTEDAAQLAPMERLKLVRILLDLTEPDMDEIEDVQAAWDEEITRRLDELRSGVVRGISLENMKAVSALERSNPQPSPADHRKDPWAGEAAVGLTLRL